MRKKYLLGLPILTILLTIFLTACGGLNSKKDISLSEIVNNKQETIMYYTYLNEWQGDKNKLDPDQKVEGIMLFKNGSVKYYDLNDTDVFLKDVDKKSDKDVIDYAANKARDSFESQKEYKIKFTHSANKREQYRKMSYKEPEAQKVTLHGTKSSNGDDMTEEVFTIKTPNVGAPNRTEQIDLTDRVSNLKGNKYSYGGFAAYNNQLLFRYNKNQEKTFHFDKNDTKGVKVQSNWD